jgi:hypothetical protein
VLKNHARPKWWLLYLTFPLLIGLFMLDHHLELPQRGHTVVQIGILLLVYGLIHLWVKTNSIAISDLEQRQYLGSIIVTRIPPYRMMGISKCLMYQLSDSELKGI